jgi:hypothetical protein
MYDFSNPDQNAVINCNNGWSYDKTDYDDTIPSAFNWVCDRVGYATDTFTVGTLGSAIGTVLFGILADKYVAEIEICNIYFDLILEIL